MSFVMFRGYALSPTGTTNTVIFFMTGSVAKWDCPALIPHPADSVNAKIFTQGVRRLRYIPAMTLKLTIAQIAKVAHEVNREYSRAIGDPIKPSWEDAPEDQRVSCIKGITYHQANPTSSPGDSHHEWLTEKMGTGWRYGEKYDPVMQTHPAMVPYINLPKDQQAKDFIFLAIARQLLAVEIPAEVLLAPDAAGHYAPVVVAGEVKSNG